MIDEKRELRHAYVAALRRAAEIVHKKSKMNSAFEEAILSEASNLEGRA